MGVKLLASGLCGFLFCSIVGINAAGKDLFEAKKLPHHATLVAHNHHRISGANSNYLTQQQNLSHEHLLLSDLDQMKEWEDEINKAIEDLEIEREAEEERIKEFQFQYGSLSSLESQIEILKTGVETLAESIEELKDKAEDISKEEQEAQKKLQIANLAYELLKEQVEDLQTLQKESEKYKQDYFQLCQTLNKATKDHKYLEKEIEQLLIKRNDVAEKGNINNIQKELSIIKQKADSASSWKAKQVFELNNSKSLQKFDEIQKKIKYLKIKIDPINKEISQALWQLKKVRSLLKEALELIELSEQEWLVQALELQEKVTDKKIWENVQEKLTFAQAQIKVKEWELDSLGEIDYE